MYKLKFLSFTLFISSFFAFAQQQATSAEITAKALVQKQKMAETSLVKNVPFKNIGPTVMSGRVVDVDVNPDTPSEFYVGYASGGVWHTVNNGTTFTSIFDNAATQNIGDIAVDWKSRTIWVGTGENNSSRSSYSGIGVLKSNDNGKTWEHVGLSDSHHIGRILINPNNPDEVIVGATGHLYSSNEERGIYKTVDGGKTWKQTLFVDAMSGIIDVQHAPDNFEVLFATSWTRDRKAWNFTGSGNNSAIFKSMNGGDTWEKVSTKNSGFPIGDGVGRIGIAVFDEHTIYALHDSQFHRPEEAKSRDVSGLTKEDFKTMSVDAFMKLEDKKLNEYLKTNGFHEKHRASNIKQLVSSGSVKPIDLAHYLEDANAMLFDTPVVGAEVYKSINGGKSWKKTHDDYIDGLYYSYGYYFGEIRVDTQDKNGIYILGVPLLKSKDAGKTFTSISRENVHADHQALWVNPKMKGHLINGNDGGLNMSYDDGESWTKLNSVAVGQFYAINADNETPYNIYGGLQDNGVWVGASNARENKAWHQSGQYPWEELMGGDGMQIQIDSRDANIVYTGYQFGNYFRINRETGEQKYIQPKHTLGETPYRFNWQTPILLSSHNQDILYLGGNKLMRSMNKGDDFVAISGDLTNGGKKGNVAYGTLSSISESPFQFGLIYTGSDDGVVSMTKDAGGSWSIISNTFPNDLWVSRVIASQHKKERIYVTLNGYRWDDFKVYAYMSDDYGETWKDIGTTIPASPVNVIKEDPSNENLLYLGTDNGAYVSFDMGTSWDVFSNGIPNVAIHDIVIQPEAKDLILGTHGRSIYKANIEALQVINTSSTANSITFMDVESVRYSGRWGSSWSAWSNAFEPEVTIQFYSNSSGNKTLKIRSENGTELNSISLDVTKGFNYVNYNLELTDKGKKALMKENKDIHFKETGNKKVYLPRGSYKIQIDNVNTTLEIK
ncbi:VPS10 domain-containing protein [Winogradskyella thalassocola]|uniref:Sortilin, neurotensin receptor 3 n=1 Tax=Winogradskyella thalassocola TaxID=262004 RepID=A0A1G7XF59_9FLAO|nr:sialidase family protein [Winogradskyella thalassocola]SDG82753.1 Sortilin, neurotensin receptor 3 [Winogradskyella thalassocola]